MEPEFGTPCSLHKHDKDFLMSEVSDLLHYQPATNRKESWNSRFAEREIFLVRSRAIFWNIFRFYKFFSIDHAIQARQHKEGSQSRGSMSLLSQSRSNQSHTPPTLGQRYCKKNVQLPTISPFHFANTVPDCRAPGLTFFNIKFCLFWMYIIMLSYHIFVHWYLGFHPPWNPAASQLLTWHNLQALQPNLISLLWFSSSSPPPSPLWLMPPRAVFDPALPPSPPSPVLPPSPPSPDVPPRP